MSNQPHHRGPQVGQHIGDYEIVSHLARGDMGEVFGAHHPKSGRQLAIKVLDADLCADPQLLQFYEHEVWTVNHLDHPAIVDVVDFGKLDGGRAYLVMKMLRGRSLAEHLAEHGRFSPAAVRDLLGPVLEALVAIHGLGVTHKDVKPSNIFCVQRPDGSIETQLLDTGLAHVKPLAAVPGSAAQLSSKTLPLYSAPEQVTGDLRAVGPWSDVYAVAAIGFHLLGGRPPFIGSTASEVADAHLHAPPPDLTTIRPEVHPALAQVIAQGLAKRPADRFESMQAFLNAFRSASCRPAPTLRGTTAVDDPGPEPAVSPPPTLRLGAVSSPAPVAMVPAPVAMVPAPVAVVPAPVAVVPAPAPVPSPPRKSGPWVIYTVLGVLVLVLVGVVIGLVVALGGDDKSPESKNDKGSKVSLAAKTDGAVVSAVMSVMAPPPRAVVATRPPAILPKAPRYRVDIRHRPWKGADPARATVVVYCGFAGYYCRSARDNFRRVLTDFPQDVKLVWMDYPLHYDQRSLRAAVAAAEVHAQAGRAGFWKIHDRLYGNPYIHTDDNLVKWAAEAGADSTKVRAALTSQKHRGAINAAMARARKIGVSYTPAVFVNGIRLPSGRSYEDLRARVVSEIAVANRTIATGVVSLKGYYVYVQKNALSQK